METCYMSSSFAAKDPKLDLLIRYSCHNLDPIVVCSFILTTRIHCFAMRKNSLTLNLMENDIESIPTVNF